MGDRAIGCDLDQPGAITGERSAPLEFQMSVKATPTGERPNDKAGEGDFRNPAEASCPDEINALYLQGRHFKYSVNQFQVGTAEAPACDQVGKDPVSGSQAHHLCRATETSVSAGGCMWTVDAYAGQSGPLYIFGMAAEGCARTEGRLCRTFVL